MNKTIIYTDGSSRGNPGPGGWGAIIIGNDEIREIGGREITTTNNRMELRGTIEALRMVQKGSEIIIYTDSEYVVKGITSWIHNWIKNNWKTSNRKPVVNQDLWKELLSVSDGKNIEWKNVEGHAGIAGNERTDEIATNFADNGEIQLFSGSIDEYPFTNIIKDVL